MDGCIHTYLGSRLDICHQHIENLEPKASHRLCELLFDGRSNLLLGSKHLVEIDFGHRGTHLIKHETGDLCMRVGELVEGVVEILSLNLILHADVDLYKYIVSCFCFTAAVNLLDTEREATGDGFANAATHAIEACCKNGRGKKKSSK